MNTDRAAVLTKACGWTALTTAVLVLILVAVLAGPFFLRFVVGSALPTLGFGVAAVRLGSRLAERDNAARWAAGVLLGVAFPFFLAFVMRVPGSLDQQPGARLLAAVVFGFLAATSLSVPLLLLSTSSRQDFGDEPFTDEVLVRPLGIMIVLLLFLAKSALVRQANADSNPRAGPTPRNTECEPGRLYLGQPGPGANVVKPAPPRRLASEPRARMDRFWRVSVGGEIVAPLAVSGSTVYLLVGENEAVAFDAATGGERWRQRLRASRVEPPPALIPHGEALWLREPLGEVVTLDVRTGSESPFYGASWRDAFAVGPALIYGDAPFDEVVALDRRTGRLRWEAKVEGSSRRFALHNDILIITTRVSTPQTAAEEAGQRRIVALDANTGAVRWNRTLPYSPDHPAVITESLVYLIEANDVLLALDAMTGLTAWRVPLSREYGGTIGHAPSPVTAGGLVYVAHAGILTARDAATGAERWCAGLVDGATTSIVIGDGTVFVPGVGGVTAFRASDGRPEGRTNLGAARIDSLGFGDGKLFVATTDGYLLALR